MVVDVVVVIKQDVLRLQITMYDLEAVTVVDTRDYLLKKASCLRFCHAATFNNVFEKLPACILEDDDNVRRC